MNFSACINNYFEPPNHKIFFNKKIFIPVLWYFRIKAKAPTVNDLFKGQDVDIVLTSETNFYIFLNLIILLHNSTFYYKYSAQ